ncbi:adenosylcobinamide-GDP ribazoletransferase [Acidilobus sp.]|uniref:adenosylcobinamide-GDP ribazoletransferase n=1 Tax=Acidilobus sp. TaxID=1872109 RepID=UPI003D05778C
MGLRDLLALFTRLPVGSGDLGTAASSFYMVPIVGLVEGLIVSLVGLAVSVVRPAPMLAASLMVIAHVAVTGGLHLDGLADYGDVLGSGLRGEEAVRVLKDPRKGSFAIMAVVVALAARLSAFYYLYRCPAVIVAAYVSSLEASFVAARTGAQEPYEGMASRFERAARDDRQLLLNTLTYIVIMTAIAIVRPFSLISAAALLAGFLLAADANSRLGFVNGDVMGASIEVGGVVALVLGALA